MFIKITSVTTQPNYVLLIGFSTGEFKQFDIKPLISKHPQFEALTKIDGLYKEVKIDKDGCGLYWNDDLDLSANGLYELSIPAI